MEGESTGVGRYLDGLLGGVAADESRAHWRWRLFFKGRPFAHPLWGAEIDSEPDDEARFQPIFDMRPEARAIPWEQFRLPRLMRRHKLDVVFSPSYSLPAWLEPPSVVTIHDLSFEHRGDELSFRERHRRRFLARRAARAATRVLTDTPQVAEELISTYRLPSKKVAVVPLGVDERFFRRGNEDEAADVDRLAALGVRPPYLLYVGTMFERRRPDLVMTAATAVLRSDLDAQMVLVGANRLRDPERLERLIAEAGLGDRLVRLGYVDEGMLPRLLRQARLTLYLSEYEGYGLPPLEALAAGTPTVVANGLALDHLWHDYPLRVPALEPQPVRTTVLRAWNDEILRHRVGGDGIERMARLTWSEAAERLQQELAKAAKS